LKNSWQSTVHAELAKAGEQMFTDCSWANNCTLFIRCNFAYDGTACEQYLMCV